MRKIVCQACNNRWGDHGSWVIFNRVIICDTCRLTAIQWFKESGFGLGHPFVVELIVMNRNRKVK